MSNQPQPILQWYEPLLITRKVSDWHTTAYSGLENFIVWAIATSIYIVISFLYHSLEEGQSGFLHLGILIPISILLGIITALIRPQFSKLYRPIIKIDSTGITRTLQPTVDYEIFIHFDRVKQYEIKHFKTWLGHYPVLVLHISKKKQAQFGLKPSLTLQIESILAHHSIPAVTN